jgi:hypothetical protein
VTTPVHGAVRVVRTADHRRRNPFAKEMATARRMEDGVPLTGGRERDKPDATAVDNDGFPIVAAEALDRRRVPGRRVPSDQRVHRVGSVTVPPRDQELLFRAGRA